MADINNNYKDFKNLTPFKLCVLQNFPFIEADFDAVTNYQLLCKVVEYLNKVIDNNNTQNENIKQLEQNFITLYNYVQNYFNNLDVQDEINNKLDVMAGDGTLENILYSSITKYGYLKKQIILIGDSWSDSDDWGKFNSWATWLIQFMPNVRFYRGNERASGFCNGGQLTGRNFLDLLKSTEANISNKDLITDIIVLGGSNDRRENLLPLVEGAIQEFCSYAHTTFANAKVHIGFLGWTNEVNIIDHKLFNLCYKEYEKCQLYNAAFLGEIECCTRDYNNYYNVGHMNETGLKKIAEYLVSYITSGNATYTIDNTQELIYNSNITPVEGFGMNVYVKRVNNNTDIFISNLHEAPYYSLILLNTSNLNNGLNEILTFKDGLLLCTESETNGKNVISVTTQGVLTINGQEQYNIPLTFIITNKKMFLYITDTINISASSVTTIRFPAIHISCSSLDC